MPLIKLSTGVEISEETIIAALKKTGIETTKPKHIFKAGDVAYKVNSIFSDKWRFIVSYNGQLLSFDADGDFMSSGQEKFECEGYEFIGKQRNLLKNQKVE